MGLNFDADCQAALDLARRALPDGAELDVAALMAALYHSTALKYRFPKLGPYLRQPVPRRAIASPGVPVAAPLQSVLDTLSAAGGRVTALDLFRELTASQAGRAALAAAGAPAGELDPFAPPPPAAPPRPQPVSAWRSSPERQNVVTELSAFGRMLTAGEPPRRSMVGMEAALGSLIRTLSKMGRRNAIVVGYPGTGKSALVHELARLMVACDALLPPRLRECDIFELSPAFLRSGASMVGQYEERIKKLIEILKAHPKVILFIDEIHSMFQSGMHHSGPFSDANEMFKGVLASGEIACIGCTTTAEYRHYIEPDGALTRRFGIIRIEAPSREATVKILEARRPRIEEYYAPLKVPPPVLERVVELTEDHLPGRFQPDKSIQLLDDACAWCATSNPPAAVVTDEALWRALEDMVGHAVLRHEKLSEADLVSKLRAAILGQDETVAAIARAFISGLGDWQKRSGPRGVFFFCGPTGVGKTETALLLARIIGGGREALLRIDCNTLQGSGMDSRPALNRLLGAPPGYIGYTRGQGGALSRVRDMPDSVVLFDEIEKADPGVGRLLLQILDDGKVEDADGSLLDFRRSFLIFTTNAGCVYDRKPLGFEKQTQPRQSAEVDLEALKQQFRSLGYGEEFLARIRHFFTFRSLDGAAAATVIDRQLERLRSVAEVRGMRLEWTPAVKERLVSSWQPRFGVRHLTGILRNRISEQISLADAQGELAGVCRILLEALPEGTASGDVGLARRRREGDTLVVSIN